MSGSASARLEVAALTHVGRRRYVNEDCVAIDAWQRQEPSVRVYAFDLDLATAHVLLVADGMGGHPAGDVASRTAASFLAPRLLQAAGAPEAIAAALHGANQALFDQQRRNPDQEGMGTTVTGLVLGGAHHPQVFCVGDSRVYRITGEHLVQLTRDDASSVSVPVFGFEIPMRALSQCLGGYANDGALAPQVVTEPLAAGDGWLICSDGVHDMLDHAAMESCLSSDPHAIAADMFHRAMDAGGNDNITIVCAMRR